MKQFTLFSGNKFGDFFKKKTPKEIILISAEDLKNQIVSLEYGERLKTLLKEDLCKNYDKVIVEKVLEDVSVLVYEDSPFEKLVDEEDTELDQQNIEPETHYFLDSEKQKEIDKIENRVPKWFRNPHQINTRILVAYMELLGDGKSVPFYKLEASCRSIITFKSNYNQMKIIGERNHAKIFEEVGSRITLWEPTRHFVKKEYEKFRRRSN